MSALPGFGGFIRSPGEFNPDFPASAYTFASADDKLRERIAILAAIILGLIPITRRILMRGFDFLRSRRTRGWSLLAIAILSAPTLFALGAVRGRLMLPDSHDESMYRLQTTFAAHGLLWRPPLPEQIRDFFEVPYVLNAPVRAPVHFPGTALAHRPGVWLHLPYVAIPLAIATAILLLVYLIVGDLLDGLAGWLAVLLLLSLALFRWLALAEMSHSLSALLALLLVWSWLSWREVRGMKWVWFAGFVIGYYAITRPLDAVCIGFPVACAWLWDLRHTTLRIRIRIATAALLPIVPFILLQLVFNHALTGHVLQAPLDYYYKFYFNIGSMGLQKYDPAFVPPTMSRQIIDTYHWIPEPMIKNFMTPRMAAVQWFNFRVPTALGSALPTLLLVALLPAGWVARVDHRARVLMAICFSFMLGTACFYLFHRQYVMVIAPVVMFTVLAGARAIADAFPFRGFTAVFLTLAIGLLALHRVARNAEGMFQNLDPGTLMRADYQMIPRRVKTPALVLFTYHPEDSSYLEEPAYNWDVMNPDDAPIIRAHDLGPRNSELFAYYAQRQPDRSVYVYDHMANKFQSLGVVSHLAQPTPTHQAQ